MTCIAFSILLLAGTTLYVLFTVWVRRGMNKLQFCSHLPKDKLPSVSVIVPARDEDHNIEETLQSLVRQNYPAEKMQVVMVNDRSRDRTPEIMARYARKYKNFIQIDIDTLSSGVSPKKNALEWGIAASQCEIIFTTDADCLHSPDWLRSMVAYFQPGVGLVAGLTLMEPDDESLLHRLHTLDYISHSFTGAGAIGNGCALTCTGANLAYRYEAFTQLGGFGDSARIVSGDDEFFLQKLVNSKRWKAVFALGKDTIVRSLPPETAGGIIHQRLRWGSKGLFYPLKMKRLMMGIFIYFLFLLLAPVFILMNLLPWWVFLISVGAKLASEFSVISRGFRLFEERFPWGKFLALFSLHPLIIVLSAVGGHLLSFKWKGGQFHSRVG